MRDIYSNLKKSLVLALGMLCFSGSAVFAQTAPQEDPNVTRYHGLKAELAGFVVPSEIKEDWNYTFRNTKKIHVPGVDVQKDQFKALKAKANKEYQEAIQAGQVGQSAAKTNKTTLAGPEVGEQFFGNGYDGGIPNDNSIAISEGGIVVSVTNSRIHVYDEDGSLKSQVAMGAFAFQTGVTPVGTTIGGGLKFDPKVTYDPNADRFVWVWLNGAESSNSNVVICFTKTNDPDDGWWVYELDGNVTGSVWTDFPQIAISEEELFITGNLFFDVGGSNGSAIWQIELADGYAGSTLDYDVVSTPYFSLNPVEGGSEPYGPNMYFVRNNNSGGSQIFIHEITNTIAGGGVLSSPSTLSGGGAPSYSLPADADQPGSIMLNTNDVRVQTTYFENDRIEFAFNCAGPASKPSIYYGTIRTSPLGLDFASLKGQIITMDDWDIGYPGLTYGGVSDGDNASFLMFNLCASDVNPGNGAVYIDEDHTVSDPVELFTGNSSINGFDNPSRWGDYADIAQRHNNLGEAWVGGSYAWSSSGRTYISQIFTPSAVSVAPGVKPAEQEGAVFPNPVVDMVNFRFPVGDEGRHTLRIYDAAGNMVKELETVYLRKGEGIAKFSTQYLSNGIYFVNVQKEGVSVFKERFIVSH